MLIRCRASCWAAAATLILAALLGCRAEDTANATTSGSGSKPPPTAVDIVTLRSGTVMLTTTVPARIMPLRIAQVRPQVDGIVTKLHLGVEDSLEVDAGQPLYQIDPARYQAALQSARAELQKARANLAAARVTQKRYQGLITTSAVSQQQFDDIEATLQLREAEVAVAQANLERAQVQLSYTLISAPISGRIEQFMVTEGALLEEQQPMPLATIRQLDPVYVDMWVSADQVVELRQRELTGDVNRSTADSIALILKNGDRYPHPGTLLYTEMTVNEKTGSVLVRAIVPNPDRLLMPGLSITAELEQGQKVNALLVPQRAVTFNREGQAEVLMINADNQVIRQQLRLGRALGSRWLVESGARDGDRVIVAGLQKVRPGTTVEPTDISSRSGDEG